jgi:hypothetical protein
LSIVKTGEVLWQRCASGFQLSENVKIRAKAQTLGAGWRRKSTAMSLRSASQRHNCRFVLFP